MSNLLSRKRLVFITVIALMIVTAGLYTSYAINVSVEEGTSTDYDMALNFNLLDSLDMEITVPAGKTKVFDIDIKNSYNDAVKYGVTYSMVSPATLPDGVTVAQSSNGKNSPMGTVKANFSISVSVTVTNDSSSNVTLSFSVINGYKNGGDLIIPEGKTLVSGKLDKSGANAPTLTNGLIPVMYDESISTWVKADTTNNTEYSWYNYSDKKWANAVLVGNGVAFVSEENKQINRSQTGYYSHCDNLDGLPREITFTFTTGDSGGELSFFYYIESDNVNSIEILLNGNVIVSEQSYYNDEGYYTYLPVTYYSTQLSPNTSYTILVSYECDTSPGDARIGDIKLPDDLEVPLQVSTTGENAWVSDESYFVQGDSYTIDDYGNFVVDGTFNSDLEIGKYICGIVNVSQCKNIYQISEIGDDVIIVDSYTAENEYNRGKLKTAKPGTEIPEDMILAYYVWIPRFKYKVWNINKEIGVDLYDAQTTGIDIVFENGTSTTGDVTCTYNFNVTADEMVGNEFCTGTNGESYYTHPAFTFGEDELTGFWMGKYELSSTKQECTDSSCMGQDDCDCSGGNTTSLTPRILPNVMNWSGNTVNNYKNVIINMNSVENIYGLFSDLSDSHMITNMEWGAVAYLTNSNYGLCANGNCDKMDYNRDYYYGAASITGSGGSSTGNIYGVYDMYGGADEHVSVGFSSNDLGKYVTTYATIPQIDGAIEYFGQTAFNIMKLGDAVGEIGLVNNTELDPEYKDSDGWIDSVYPAIVNPHRSNGWYNSFVVVLNSMTRGGGTLDMFGPGYIFDTNSADNSGQAFGTRAVLVAY